MTYEQFNTSLDQSAPPPSLSVYLQALWYDGNGNWEQSHETIQDVPDKTASWIHAYLHRKEGDTFNAKYWYSKADKLMPDYSLNQEWEELVKALL
jgi:hypothetical protein